MLPLRSHRTVCSLIVGWMLLWLQSGAWAFDMTKQEAGLLPPQYCTFTNSSREAIANPEVYQRLLHRYGEGWTHIHHYCRSLVYVMRFNRYGQTPSQKQGHATQAIKEIDYVIDNSPPDFPLMPMMLMKKAEFLYLFNNKRGAIQHLVDSLESRPDFPGGYALLAYYLNQTGNAKEAEAVIARGRQAVSNQAELDTALQRYGLTK